jgi:hypothetical protein
MACFTGTPFLPWESEPVHSTGYPLRREADVPEGFDHFDAKGLEIILAGVSYRRECVRGEGEWQPSGLPVSRGA